MKKFKKCLKQTLAIILVSSMLVCEIPTAFVYAAEESLSLTTEEPFAENVEDSLQVLAPKDTGEEPIIVAEVEELRDEKTKYFEMSDGTIKACIYLQAVHYLEDGAYEEIDNTLELAGTITDAVGEQTVSDSVGETATTSSDEIEEVVNEEVTLAEDVTETLDVEALDSFKAPGAYYENKANAFTTRLPVNYEDGYTEFADENGYVRFMLIGNTEGSLEKAESKLIDSSDETVAKNINSKATYASLKQNIDLEYELAGNKLKETIVLNEVTKQDFVFYVETSASNAQLNEDGSVSFYDVEGNAIYSFAAPYMIDHAGEYTESVEVELVPKNEGYLLTYKPDEEWLYDSTREYPVRIDPTMSQGIIVDDEYVFDTYVYSGQTDDSEDIKGYDDVINIGKTTQLIENEQMVLHGMIQVEIPDEIVDSDYIIDAKMYLAHASNQENTGGAVIALHELTVPFFEDTTYWGNHPPYDTNAVDYAIVDTDRCFEGTEMSYDVYNFTELANKWHNGGTENYGMLLKLLDEDTTVSSNQQVFYLSTNYEYIEDVPKFVEITYQNMLGIEEYWGYNTYDLGTAGTASVNLYNGNLVYTHTDAINNTAINAFSVAHVFNGGMVLDNTAGCGKGWTLNILQRIDEATVSGNSAVKFVYTDEDGTKHYLVETDGQILDEDGLGYTYSVSTESGMKHQITTLDDSIMLFDEAGYLRIIRDANGNEVRLNVQTTSDGRSYVDKITTSSGDAITLQYDSNHDYRLSSVTDKAGRVTTYGYDSKNYLTSITYPDGTQTTFGYRTTGGQLLSVRGYDQTGYNFSYTDVGRIKKVSVKGIEASGNIDTYEYDYCQTKVTDSTNYTTTYQFDTEGRITGIYDGEGNICSQEYTEDETSASGIFKNNKVTVEAGGSVYVNNLLKNGLFTSELDNWTSSGGTASVNTAKTLQSPKSIAITNSSEGKSVIQQTVSGLTSGTYTLSGYLQGEDISGAGGVGVQIVTNTRTITSELLFDPVDTLTDNGFTRISATVTLESGESITQVEAGLIDASGTATIDSLQLEEGEAEGPLNLIENSSFEMAGSGDVPYQYTASEHVENSGRKTDAAHTGTYGLLISGDVNYSKSYSQSIRVSGVEGDSYAFGAWAKAHSAEKHGENTPFAMILTFKNSDGTETKEIIEYNTAVNEWQFVSQTAFAEKAYNSIEITLQYENNVNVGYFDDVFLYRDKAVSYSYDSNGNVVSTTDTQEQTSQYQYDENNLTKTLDETGNGSEYVYDENNNLITSRDSAGTQTVVETDSYGNVTEVRAMAGDSLGAIEANETYYICLQESNQYLTVENAGTENGTKVIQADFAGENNQRWKVEQTTDGYFRLIPAHATGKRLSIQGAFDLEDANVIIDATGVGDEQKLQVQLQDDYTYTIVPKVSSSKRKLTVNNSSEQNYVTLKSSATGEGEQRWYFENVEDEFASTVSDGAVYRIRAAHSGKYLNVSNGSAEVGTVINQYQSTYEEYQEFLFTKYGDSEYYTITPAHDATKVLSVSDSSTSDSQSICLADATATDDKLFKLEYNEERQGVKIIPKNLETDNKVLEVSGASMEDEAGIVCGTDSTSADNQYFHLEYCVEEMNSSTDYTEDGNYVSSTTDGRGYTATFSYDEDRDLLKSVVDAKGVGTNYTYNQDNNRLLSVTASNAASASANTTVAYSYNTNGSIKTITSPNELEYGFSYDGFGRPLSTTVEGQTLGTYTYRDNYTSLVSRFDYGNGSYQEYTYDNSDRILTESANGVLTKSYIYDKYGNVAKETHNQLGLTTKYRYDLSGRLTGLSDSNGQKINYVYDEYDRVTHEYYNSGTNDMTIGYDYGNNAEDSTQETGVIYGVSYDGEDKIQYSYDKLGRLNTRTLVGNDANTKTSYTYLKGDKINSTTSMIDTMSLYYSVDEESQPSWTEYSYTYDEVGNITSISKDGVVQESYTYDSLNQLTQVQRGNDTYRYTYDNGGNLVNVIKNDIDYLKEYEYDEQWKDLLVYYNDDIITYDSIGNPLRYRDGMQMTWTNGRQLSSITGLTNNVSYEYDGDGYRKYKTVGTEPKISYSYVGGVLRSEKSTDREMLYFYDENGTIAGVKVIEDGVTSVYYYQLNIQGDVIGILNEDGVQVVAYTYDEWGNVLSITGSESTGIGALNPIRYRGYYYDSETGFYYLLSRYYDPETGRFINADDYGYLGASGTVLGYNLFAYCENNVIMMVDINGALVSSAIKLKYSQTIRSNYLYNRDLNISGIISNQHEGDAAKYRFGYFKSDYNGCGWIATYNATQILGIRYEPHDIIREFEVNGVLLYGAFGTKYSSLIEFFVSRKYRVKNTSIPQFFDFWAKKFTVNIIYFLHKRGAHIVALRWDGKKFIGYNTFSNSGAYDDWGKSINSFLKKNKYVPVGLISISRPL